MVKLQTNAYGVPAIIMWVLWLAVISSGILFFPTLTKAFPFLGALFPVLLGCVVTVFSTVVLPPFAGMTVMQKILMGATALSLGFCYGLFANFIPLPAANKLLPGGQVQLHFFTAFAMFFGGPSTVFLLFKTVPADDAADQSEKAQKPAKQPKPPKPAKPAKQPKASKTKGGPVAEPSDQSNDQSKDEQAVLDAAPEASQAVTQKAPAVESPSASAIANLRKAQASKSGRFMRKVSPTSGDQLPVAAQPSDSNTNLPAQSQPTGDSEQKRPIISASATRLQAQKRKSTSTFTKLQALSASGTGSVTRKTDQPAEEGEPDSLKSILDRLDTKYDGVKEEVHSAPDEVAMDSIFMQESLLPSPEVASQSDPGKSRSGAKEPPSLAGLLDSLELAPPAARKSGPGQTTPAGTAKPSSSTPLPSSTPKQGSGPAQPLRGPSQAPVRPSNQPPQGQRPGAQPVRPAGQKPGIPLSGAQRPKGQPPISPGQKPPQNKPIQTPSQRPAAPSSPQRPGSASPASQKSGGAPIRHSIFPNAPIIVPSQPSTVSSQSTPSTPKAGEAPQDKNKPELSKAENLFDKKVDTEIDDIFSTLVPDEALKEVGSTRTPASEESSSLSGTKSQGETALSSKSESQSPSAAPRDQEIDDLLSVLLPSDARDDASPEASSSGTQKAGDTIESKSEATESAKSAESTEQLHAQEISADEGDRKEPEASTPDPSGQEESRAALFKETALNQEIDEIFSNLAPSEAQLEVTDNTLKSVHGAASATDTTDEKNKVSADSQLSFKPEETGTAKVEAPSETPGNTTASTQSSDIKTGDAESFEPAGTSTGLFQESALDQELDDIFSALAPTDAQLSVTDETLRKVKTESFAPPANEDFAPTAKGDDASDSGAAASEDIDALFSKPRVEVFRPAVERPVSVESEPTQSPQPVSAELETEAIDDKTEAIESPSATPSSEESNVSDPKEESKKRAQKELKEFGMLSSKDLTPLSITEGVGTMKTIGKLLLEVQAIENIIKKGESGTFGSGLTTARIISEARGAGINALLTSIDSHPGVVGSVIVGHDGLVMASTVTESVGMDKDSLGVLSMSLLSTSNLGTMKLDIGKLRQMVMITDTKTTILTDVDVGILATFLDNNEVSKVDAVLQKIHDTLH